MTHDDDLAVSASQAIEIPMAEGELRADLRLPSGARALVIFAHGAGSSRFSRRNRLVAEALDRDGFGTLLFDLLTQAEEARDVRTGEFRFDIALQAGRLVRVLDWVRRHPELRHLAVGCFGASTGAAVALTAAAERPALVRAVVSRGGRPDLVGDDRLARVQAPTLLLVGGADGEVLALNRAALRPLDGHAALEVIPGATHLFPEPGALEAVAHAASGWFERYLPGAAGPA